MREAGEECAATAVASFRCRDTTVHAAYPPHVRAQVRLQVRLVVGLIAFVASGAAVVPSNARAQPPRIGDAAPGVARGDFGKDLRSGRPIALQGRIVVVEFFATWCPACRRSLADTRAARAALAPDDAARVAVVVVDVGEEPDDVRRFFAEEKLPEDVAVVADVSRREYLAWGVARLPTVFVLDVHGTIRHINRGHGTGFRDRLLAWLGRRLTEN